MNDVFVFALLILMLVQPLFGYIGDKISHRRAVITFSVLAFFGIAPLFRVMSTHAHNTTIAFLAVLALFLILSFYTSVSGIFKASLFPEHVRALGTGFSFALGNAIFGGSTPYVALQFKHANLENGFFVYVAVMMAFMFIVAMCLPKNLYLTRGLFATLFVCVPAPFGAFIQWLFSHNR